MGKVIVASQGSLPQEEREALKLGLVGLVAFQPPKDWSGNPVHVLTCSTGDYIRTTGGIKPKEWHAWFDKAYLLDPEHNCRNWLVKIEAIKLLSPLTARPRLVLIGYDVASSFGIESEDMMYRWRWVHWSTVHEGVVLEDNRAQLVAVVPDHEVRSRENFVFWQGLARACRSGRGRTNG